MDGFTASRALELVTREASACEGASLHRRGRLVRFEAPREFDFELATQRHRFDAARAAYGNK